MKQLFREIMPALMTTLLLVMLLCGVYPLSVWGIAQVVFPDQAQGSLIRDEQGAVIGSELIGQPFTADRYFHPRPSVAGAGYDATSSGGSNFGPLSQKLSDQIAARVQEYRTMNGLSESTNIPADAVTASASGLDPHISLANARLQAARVARVRHLSLAAVNSLIDEHTDGRSLGIFGEAGTNVLELNLALDRLK